MKKQDTSVPAGKVMIEKEALRRAAELCSRKEQCAGHIRNKLKEWDMDDEASNRIVQKLQQEQFLDDRRYARAFVRDKFKFNGWGRIKISHMLRAKGVEEDIIKEAMEEIDQHTYEMACAEMIRAKSGTLKEKNPYTRKARLYRFASGRGFESELIYRVLNMIEGW